MQTENETGSENPRSHSRLLVLAILPAIAIVGALLAVVACNRSADDTEVVENTLTAENTSTPPTPQTVTPQKRDATPLPRVGFEGFERWNDRIAAYEDLLTQGQSEQTAIVDIFGPKASKPDGAEYVFRYSVFDCNNIWVLVDFVDDVNYERNVQIVKDFLAAGAAPWPENDDEEWQITQEHGRVRVAIPITLLRSLSQHPEVEQIYFSVPTAFAIPI